MATLTFSFAATNRATTRQERTTNRLQGKVRSPPRPTSHRCIVQAEHKHNLDQNSIERAAVTESRLRAGLTSAALALSLSCATVVAPPCAHAGEVYEGMFGGPMPTEIADVKESMATAQTKMSKVMNFLTTCADNGACNDDLAALRDDMQSAVRNTQVAIRSAGKNDQFDIRAVDLMRIADEFDCIEIRRDKSTQFLVNQFGAAKVGGGVLGADHVKDRVLCSADADKLFGKNPKTTFLSKEALPVISEAASIINELQAKL